MFETMQQCRLSACFRSSQYPTAATYATAVGIAVHSVLEQLPIDARAWPRDEGSREFRRHARDLFDEALDQGSKNALDSPRHRSKAPGDDRAHRARKGVMRAATRLLEGSQGSSGGGPTLPELHLSDPSGVVQGRPDLIVQYPGGATILDFKTGSFAREESLVRFEVQLMLYAYLWHANTGSWPTDAAAVNVLTGKRHAVEIDPTTCLELAAQVRTTAKSVQDSDFEELADTGPHCHRCDYRPWCEPYWSSPARNEETDYEGVVVSCEIAHTMDTSSASGWLKLTTPAADVTFVVRQGPDDWINLTAGSRIRLIQVWNPPESSAKVISGYTDVIILSA